MVYVLCLNEEEKNNDYPYSDCDRRASALQWEPRRGESGNCFHRSLTSTARFPLYLHVPIVDACFTAFRESEIALAALQNPPGEL